MVHRKIEEALYLLRMQVHREHAMDTGSVQQVGDQLRGDRNARLIFAVLSSVTEKWNHRGDAIGARAPRRIDHDEQFHQVLISRRASRLDNEDVAPTNIFLDSDISFAVRKRANGRLPERHAEVFADALGQFAVGRAAKDFHFWL